MAASKRGGLGTGAFFQNKEKDAGAAAGTRAPRASTEKTEKLTLLLPQRQVRALEELKSKERKAGKKKSEATITALVIEAIDLLLAKRG